jgi:VWFA-related protein
MQKRARLLQVVIAVAILAGDARIEFAQDWSGQAFKSGIDLVTVDVTVLDRNLMPVRGLVASDFSVREDGHPRPIVSFASVELPVERSLTEGLWQRDAPYDVVTNDQAREGRLVVVLLDASTPNGPATSLAMQIARTAIAALGPDDMAAVVRSSVFSNNGLSQGFTADRSRLLSAIDSPFMGTTDPPTTTFTGLQPSSPVPTSLWQTQSQCEVILNIARAMRGAERRRKLLLFIGSTLGLGGTSQVAGEERPCRENLQRELTIANLTVHVVDPAGLLTTAATAEYSGRLTPALEQQYRKQNQIRLDILRRLPDLTGGRLVANTNDPLSSIPSILAETGVYYLLGFEPGSSAESKSYHDIQVQVHRKGVGVHARGGYLSKSNSTVTLPKPADPTGLPPELVAALDQTLPVQGIPMSVQAVAFPSEGGRSSSVMVAIGAGLTAVETVNHLDLLVGAFDDKGRSVALQRGTLEIPAVGSKRARLKDGFVTRLELRPGRYELRVAARDRNTGRIGSVFSFVDVPNVSDQALSLSGPVLYREGQASGNRPDASAFLPVVPIVTRLLSRSDQVGVFVRLHQAGTIHPIRIRVSLIDTRDETVDQRTVDLGVEAFNGPVADVRAPLPLKERLPGKYLLEVTASLDRLRVTQRARVEISSNGDVGR